MLNKKGSVKVGISSKWQVLDAKITLFSITLANNQIKCQEGHNDCILGFHLCNNYDDKLICSYLQLILAKHTNLYTMKPYYLFGVLGIVLCLSACSLWSPTYFGTKYPVTNTVETFYSANDIKRPYKVIGHMVAPISRSASGQERTRLSLVEQAKKVGGDGLIFSDIRRQTNKETTDDFSIKAEVVIFTDK